MNENAVLAGGEFLLAVAIFFATSGLISWVLMRTARFRPEAMVVVSVSVLSLVAIVLAVASGSESISTALISLAGVGLGALAGAVRSLFPQRDLTQDLKDVQAEIEQRIAEVENDGDGSPQG